MRPILCPSDAPGHIAQTDCAAGVLKDAPENALPLFNLQTPTAARDLSDVPKNPRPIFGFTRGPSANPQRPVQSQLPTAALPFPRSDTPLAISERSAKQRPPMLGFTPAREGCPGKRASQPTTNQLRPDGEEQAPRAILRTVLRTTGNLDGAKPVRRRLLGDASPAWHAGGQRFESAWLHFRTSLVVHLLFER
jgi:hypothetical protein